MEEYPGNKIGPSFHLLPFLTCMGFSKEPMFLLIKQILDLYNVNFLFVETFFSE